MKRLISACVFFLAFGFCVPCEAGPIRKIIDRFRRDKPAVEKKVTKEKSVRLIPSRCHGGTCNVK